MDKRWLENECVRAVAVLAVMTALLAGCRREAVPSDDPNALTLERAVELIKADPVFLDAGKDVIDLGEATDEAEQKLVKAGYLEPAGRGALALTALGQEAAKDWEVLATGKDGKPRRWRVLLTHRAFLEVTRSTLTPRAVTVGFSWRWEPTGPIGTVVGERGPVRLSSVEFWRYDEGWRMSPIDF